LNILACVCLKQIKKIDFNLLFFYLIEGLFISFKVFIDRQNTVTYKLNGIFMRIIQTALTCIMSFAIICLDVLSQMNSGYE